MTATDGCGSGERIMRATAAELDAMRARGETRSDWQAAEALSAEEVERLADEDDGPLPDGWESTVEVGLPTTSQDTHLRVNVER